MELILLEKIENLGGLGDKVNVKSGYGRNFLIPSGKAVSATEANLAAFEARRAELEKAAAEALAAAQARHDAINETVVTITANAGDEGKLFGSVGTGEIADALAAAGKEVDRHEVRLPLGAFRQTGEYQVEIHLHTDLNATVTVNVVPEEGGNAE